MSKRKKKPSKDRRPSKLGAALLKAAKEEPNTPWGQAVKAAKRHLEGDANKKGAGKKSANPLTNLDVKETSRRLMRLADQKVFNKADLGRIKEGIADFLGLILVFNEALTHADTLEVAPKPRKKRTSISLSSLCSQYLGSAAKASPLAIPMPQMELELLMFRLVEDGVCKSIPKYNHVVMLPDWKLRKRARYYIHRHLQSMSSFVKYWGAYVKKPGDDVPPILILNGFDKAHDSYSLLAYHVAETPEDTEKVSDWINKMRIEYSPFRGNVCIWDRHGVEFNERPRGMKWDDIVVDEKLHDEFDKCLHMLKNPADYRKNNLPVKRGIVLAGPPGVGKTVHLECLITEVCDANLPVFHISNRIDPSGLSDIYELAEQVGPSLIVLEDIDTVTAKRTDNVYDDAGYSGNVSMLNALLTVLDGTSQRDGVITVATTNHPQALDRALASRPGRFDRTFNFGYPSAERRLEIMRLHAGQRNLDLDVDGIFERAGTEYDWILNDGGVTPSHLAEAVDSVVRDKTRDPKIDFEESLLAAVDALKTSINTDDRFIEKEEAPVGFGK